MELLKALPPGTTIEDALRTLNNSNINNAKTKAAAASPEGTDAGASAELDSNDSFDSNIFANTDNIDAGDNDTDDEDGDDESDADADAAAATASPGFGRRARAPAAPGGLLCCLRRCLRTRPGCYSFYFVTRWRVTRAVLFALALLLFSALLHHEREAINTSVQSVQTLLQRPRPGAALAAAGLKAHHPIVIVPGIVSTGLEVWQGRDCTNGLFRQRIWGSTVMVRTILLGAACWADHMRLNYSTGLDPDGIKVRAAEGIEAADYLLPGFWYVYAYSYFFTHHFSVNYISHTKRFANLNYLHFLHFNFVDITGSGPAQSRSSLP